MVLSPAFRLSLTRVCIISKPYSLVPGFFRDCDAKVSAALCVLVGPSRHIAVSHNLSSHICDYADNVPFLDPGQLVGQPFCFSFPSLSCIHNYSKVRLSFLFANEVIDENYTAIEVFPS